MKELKKKIIRLAMSSEYRKIGQAVAAPGSSSGIDYEYTVMVVSNWQVFLFSVEYIQRRKFINSRKPFRVGWAKNASSKPSTR